MGALNEPLLQADEKCTAAVLTAPLPQQPPREASAVAWGLGSEVLLITPPYRSLAEEKEEAASVPSALSAVMVVLSQFLCFMLLVVRLALPGCHSLISFPIEVLGTMFVLDGMCMTLASVLLLISLLTVSSREPPAATDDVEGAHSKKRLLERNGDAGRVAAADGSTVSGLLCLLPRHVVVLLCVLDCLLAVGVAVDLFLTLSAMTQAQPSIGFGSLGLVSDHFP